MNKIQIIRHGDLSIREVLDIIEIKSIAWPYDVDSQFRWIIRNLLTDDLHFLLRDQNSGAIVAYLNLVEVEAEIERGKITKCWGLGNVCARQKGRGSGRELLEHLNCYIESSGKPGILLCKENVLGFYSKMNWEQLPLAVNLGEGVYAMQYKCPSGSILFSINRSF